LTLTGSFSDLGSDQDTNGFKTSDASILNLSTGMMKRMSKNQILSLELGKKFIHNIPGVMIEGSVVPVPSK